MGFVGCLLGLGYVVDWVGVDFYLVVGIGGGGTFGVVVLGAWVKGG